MARIRDIVLDSHHAASLARFWAAALDGYQIAPYDEAELARLRAEGMSGPEDDPTVLLEPPSPEMPRLWVQLVPEGKTAKNRMHLDLTADDPDTEVARLVDLGAAIVADHGKLVTLTDPHGNEFCILR
jgi:hypothetical protein